MKTKTVLNMTRHSKESNLLEGGEPGDPQVEDAQQANENAVNQNMSEGKPPLNIRKNPSKPGVTDATLLYHNPRSPLKASFNKSKKSLKNELSNPYLGNLDESQLKCIQLTQINDQLKTRVRQLSQAL